MPIFCVKSVKIYTGQKKFTWVYSWDPWQIWGMGDVWHGWQSCDTLRSQFLFLFCFSKLKTFQKTIFNIIKLFWCSGLTFSRWARARLFVMFSYLLFLPSPHFASLTLTHFWNLLPVSSNIFWNWKYILQEKICIAIG